MCANKIEGEGGREGGKEWYQASVGLSYQAKCSKGTIVRAR